jgi:membrane-associated PAP2 superfamily phosphatase
MDRAFSPDARRAQIWLQHAWIPVLLFTGVAGLFAAARLDVAIARALFFDASGPGWIGAHSWFVNEFVHTGGRWLVRGIALLALATCIASFWIEPLRDLRRPAAYFTSAIVLTVAVVGLLKVVTNVDCPWDLDAFGGRFPFVALFSSRPDELPRGRCFPAAHASSGYAFMALYFLAHERSRTLARIGLALGLLLGVIFGVAQQSRGAHFASHDLWSAFLGWMIPLTLYAFTFGGRLYARSARSALHGSHAPGPSSRPFERLKRRRTSRNGSPERPSETCSTICARKG